MILRKLYHFFEDKYSNCCFIEIWDRARVNDSKNIKDSEHLCIIPTLFKTAHHMPV